MFNQQVARYAASLSWRFFVVGAFVIMLLMPLLPTANPDSTEALLMYFAVQVLFIYCSMYLSPLWMQFSLKQK